MRTRLREAADIEEVEIEDWSGPEERVDEVEGTADAWEESAGILDVETALEDGFGEVADDAEGNRAAAVVPGVELDGVAALLALPEPPAQAAAWFARTDLPGAEEHAWEKIAELLIDVAAYVAPEIPEDPRGPRDPRSADAWAEAVADDYAADPRSARVPTVLAEADERRRRR